MAQDVSVFDDEAPKKLYQFEFVSRRSRRFRRSVDSLQVNERLEMRRPIRSVRSAGWDGSGSCGSNLAG